LSGQSLSDADADRIVIDEIVAFEGSRPEKPDFTIVETVDQSTGDSGIIFHKVLPPVFKRQEPLERSLTLDPSSFLYTESVIEEREQRYLSLSIQIYDDKVTELIWREDGRAITIWSNINFCYLTPLADIETDRYIYSLFAMVSKTTTEKELDIRERYEAAGIEQVWKEIPDPSVFTSRDPEYIVFPDSREPIPEELYEAMDALHLYYADNETDLKNAFLRNQSLAEARKRYKEKHPKPKEPTVVHYWKIEQEGSK
jgi:hypothetical protein